MFHRLRSALLGVGIAMVALSLVGAWGEAAEAAASGPASPPAGASVRVIDDFTAAEAELRKVWEPMEGSPPVVAVRAAGQTASGKFACPFAAGKIERASWDRKGGVDMTGCKGVQFRFRSKDVSSVGSFVMYFQSGKGWYRGGFYAPGNGEWVTVRVPKNGTTIEESPAGWGKVEAIRLSAWRGGNVDTEFEIADLALYGGGGQVVILRADSVAASHPEEEKSVSMFADVMAELLDRAGVPYSVLSDLDVLGERLQTAKVVVLPYNPDMPPEAIRTLTGFAIKGGGALLAAYTLPERLQQVIEVRLGRHIPQSRKGQFACIRAAEAGGKDAGTRPAQTRPAEARLAGQPAEVKQASWNIRHAEPASERGRVAAWWYDDQGKPTGEAAVIVGDNGIFVTHVLLADGGAAKQQLLLAMLGRLVPSVWKDAAAGQIAAIGRLDPYEDFDAAARGIGQEAGKTRLPAASGQVPAPQAALAEAGKLRGQAVELAAAGKWAEAIAAAGKARAALIDALCLAQPAARGEHRGIWCHSAFGLPGRTWDQTIKGLADCGFTAVLPNMLWGGVAYYESDVLPVAPEVSQQGDQIAQCLAACRKYGVQCHVWKVNFNMASRTPKDFAQRMKAEGRTQVRPNGAGNDQWLCPSHPDNRKLEIDAMVEVARKYDVDGVHFDYIRYPGPEGCFCKGCRERFEKTLGRAVARWPADVGLRGTLLDKWLDFRREQITAVVAGVAEQARKVRPGIKISAAVFNNWTADRDGVGQDWKLWCQRGYMDFVCPMDYTEHASQLESMVTRQLPWASGVPCYPGIGVSCWTEPTDIARLIEQVRITRRLKTGGFTIFNLDMPVAAEVLPLLGKGMTRAK
jgi:uncharacterized lipoprotein YddW (UPF0748 family)